MIAATAAPKRSVAVSNRRLNPRKNAAGSVWPGLSSSAHSAGVSVSATKPEMVTDTAIVIANCL